MEDVRYWISVIVRLHGVQAAIVCLYWLTLSLHCLCVCVCVCVCVSDLQIDSLTLWRWAKGMDSRLRLLLTGLLWWTCGWNGHRIDNVVNILLIDSFFKENLQHQKLGSRTGGCLQLLLILCAECQLWQLIHYFKHVFKPRKSLRSASLQRWHKSHIIIKKRRQYSVKQLHTGEGVSVHRLELSRASESVADHCT